MGETFVLKQNSAEIRKKIEESGIHVCVCTSFKGTIWLDYSTNVANGVHGIGYGDETMSGEEHISLFLHEVKKPVWCDTVEEFIERILNFERNEGKESSQAT